MFLTEKQIAASEGTCPCCRTEMVKTADSFCYVLPDNKGFRIMADPAVSIEDVRKHLSEDSRLTGDWKNLTAAYEYTCPNKTEKWHVYANSLEQRFMNEPINCLKELIAKEYQQVIASRSVQSDATIHDAIDRLRRQRHQKIDR